PDVRGLGHQPDEHVLGVGVDRHEVGAGDEERTEVLGPVPGGEVVEADVAVARRVVDASLVAALAGGDGVGGGRVGDRIVGGAALTGGDEEHEGEGAGAHRLRVETQTPPSASARIRRPPEGAGAGWWAPTAQAWPGGGSSGMPGSIGSIGSSG